MDERFRALRAEIAKWITEEDIDLMISVFDAEVLIAAQDSAGFEDEHGLIRSALLIKLYDIVRAKSADANMKAEAALIRDWMNRILPGGKVPDDYPFDYIRDTLNGCHVKRPAVSPDPGIWGRVTALLSRARKRNME